MSFLTNLFHREGKGKQIVLIDIGTSSVAGAYALYKERELPVVLYTRRLPIEKHMNESQDRAMVRALKILGDTLIREGAPVLVRVTGNGSVDNILVSVDAPWQKTSVRTEQFEQEKPFIFTKSLITAALEKSSVTTLGKMRTDESIIGTILNGYETREPYGKKVHRASVIVLTSRIDEHITKSITSTLRSVYHTTHITSIAGSSLRYQAMQKAFPHERDALILDATGPITSIALVRRGLLVSITEIEVSDADTAHLWVERVENELADLAKQYPLPRTIFLLARESTEISLRETLNAANLGKLWLSDNPPKIVSVLASHLGGLVRQVTDAFPDLLLLLMALYYSHRSSKEEISGQ